MNSWINSWINELMNSWMNECRLNYEIGDADKNREIRYNKLNYEFLTNTNRASFNIFLYVIYIII
jgi:hypothetical protein